MGADLVVVPGSILMPLSESIQIIGSGFEFGAVVAVALPWVGQPDDFASLSCQMYVDADGRCFYTFTQDAATMLDLEPGEYPVTSLVWLKHGKKWSDKDGPSAILAVA